MQHGPAASSGSNPKAPGSAGGYLLAAPPMSASPAFSLRSTRAALISRLSLSMISVGVPSARMCWPHSPERNRPRRPPISNHHAATASITERAVLVGLLFSSRRPARSSSARYSLRLRSRPDSIIIMILHGAGYTVKTFAAAADFLEIAHVLSIGCVVLNIESSPSEGLELLRRLKASGNDLPV